MKPSITKYALFEYLSGRSNPIERKLTEEWIAEKENAEVFFEWLLEYEKRCPQLIADEEKALESLSKRLNEDHDHESGNEDTDLAGFYIKKTVFLKKVMMIAASVLFIGGFGWWFRDPLQYKTYQTGYGQTTNLYLEDGSRVALNANSSLKIPRFGFSSSVREVLLEGEGEFTVSHTIDNKRFVVKTSDTFKVEVLGTQFSVFARPRGTKVALMRGSVRIDYDQEEQRKEILMEPGDRVVLDKTGTVQLDKHQDPETFAAWKEQRYVFNDTSVKEIAVMIEENFGIHVGVADEKVARRTISGNFSTRNADVLLQTISEVLDLQVQVANDSIRLISK
jgi:transmembrane sensor